MVHPFTRQTRSARLMITGCLLAAPTLGLRAAEGAPLPAEQAWQLTQRYQFAQAQGQFALARGRSTEPEQRDLRLGTALATLNHPELKTPDRKQALAELQALWDTRGEPADQTGLWAGFILGRWSQNNAFSIDFDEALAWFQRTSMAGGETYIAQLAQLKATGLWLYAPLANNPDVATRLTAARTAGSAILDRGLRTSYLLLLIDGLLLHQADHHEVLARLEEVWALDIPEEKPRAKTLCQLGTLSAMTGHREQAIHYYRQYIQDYPISVRTQLVRDRLAELTRSTEGIQP
jgi:tetratricopeptide (TPR) repeat protein